MTRQVFLQFDLVMDESGGVGVPAPIRRDEVDIVVDTDRHGLPHIPATTLAGALRERLTTEAPDVVDSWLGWVKGQSAAASRIWVLGTRMLGTADQWAGQHDADNALGIVTTTAIDRHRGAAQNLTLRTVERLKAGTRFIAYLRFEDATKAETDALVVALAGWRPLLGGATSTGHGRCHLANLRTGSLNLTNDADLITWLTYSGPALVEKVAVNRQADTRQAKAVPAYSVTFETRGPLTFSLDIEGRLHPDHDLPGSSIKGVLRSRMEFILRSVDLLGPNECGGVGCGRCLACQIFGHSARGFARTGVVGQRAKVRTLSAHVAGTMRPRTHIALDRWTGGVAKQSKDETLIHTAGDRGGMLHTVEGLEAGEFTLRFEVPELDPEMTVAFEHLLALALADFDDGLVGLGRATTRGYGSVSVTAASRPDGSPLPDCRAAREWLANQKRAMKRPGEGTHEGETQ